MSYEFVWSALINDQQYQLTILKSQKFSSYTQYRCSLTKASTSEVIILDSIFLFGSWILVKEDIIFKTKKGIKNLNGSNFTSSSYWLPNFKLINSITYNTSSDVNEIINSQQITTSTKIDFKFGINCPICNGMMYTKKGKYGTFYGCENYNSKDNKCIGAADINRKPTFKTTYIAKLIKQGYIKLEDLKLWNSKLSFQKNIINIRNPALFNKKSNISKKEIYKDEIYKDIDNRLLDIVFSDDEL